MIEIRGKATTRGEGGKEINERFAPEIIRIAPTRIVAFGIDGDAQAGANSRDVA